MAKEQGTYVRVRIVTDTYGLPLFHIQQVNIMNELVDGTDSTYEGSMTLNAALDRWAEDHDYPAAYVAE